MTEPDAKHNLAVHYPSLRGIRNGQRESLKKLSLTVYRKEDRKSVMRDTLAFCRKLPSYSQLQSLALL